MNLFLQFALLRKNLKYLGVNFVFKCEYSESLCK